MIVQLEIGADGRVLQLRELRVLNRDEAVFRVDVFDAAWSIVGRPSRLASSRPTTVTA
jgi:hypothetical protein